MMILNSQFLNSQPKSYAKQSPQRTNSTFLLTTKGSDKLLPFETTTSDMSQDLIKELTIKNKLLNAQLAEYRTLVSTLNQRLQEAEEENQRLQEMLGYGLQSTQKLHTIQQQMNSLSEITTKSRRREPEQAKQQYFFHEISQMLNSYNLQSETTTWEAYITTIEMAFSERKALIHFADRISEMRQRIEPGSDRLSDLWEWIKKLGWNYHYLLTYNSSRERKHTKK